MINEFLMGGLKHTLFYFVIKIFLEHICHPRYCKMRRKHLIISYCYKMRRIPANNKTFQVSWICPLFQKKMTYGTLPQHLIALSRELQYTNIVIN